MTVDYLRAIQATEIGLRFENSEYSKWRASVRRRRCSHVHLCQITCSTCRPRASYYPRVRQT